MRTLVLGGARSGKSGYAERLLGDAPVHYLATGRRRADDPEWEARIAAHIARRPPGWRTIETTDLPGILRTTTQVPVLIDDIATWLSGALEETQAWVEHAEGMQACRARCAELVSAVAACQTRLVLVSAEVGLCVVPETRIGRIFRDELGTLNAQLAAICEEVLLVVAGLAVKLR